MNDPLLQRISAENLCRSHLLNALVQCREIYRPAKKLGWNLDELRRLATIADSIKQIGKELDKLPQPQPPTTPAPLTPPAP